MAIDVWHIQIDRINAEEILFFVASKCNTMLSDIVIYSLLFG